MKLLDMEIEVIALFLKGEKPKPCKFRYTDSDGNFRVVKVEKVLSVSEEYFPGSLYYVYQCQSNLNGNPCRYQIDFNTKDFHWLLHKL